MCICTMYINTSCICKYIYIIRINYVCLSLRLFVSSSFIQHVHKMLHGNTLQTLRHQALWHSNNVGNLRNSCIPSGIRHQNFAFEARLHDRPKFQVIHRASKKHQKSKHLRASRSSKWSFRNTTAPHRWVCQAVGLAVEVDAWHRVPDPGSRNDHHTRPQVTPQVTPLARTVV